MVRPLMIVSQLPPPVHGSTVMTERCLRALDQLGVAYHLVQRPFSTEASEVGRLTISKLGRAPKYVLKSLIRSWQSDYAVVFLTSRTGSFILDTSIVFLLRATRTQVILWLHTQGYTALSDRSVVLRWAVGKVLNSAVQVGVLSPRLSLDVDAFASRAPILISNTVPDPGELTTLENQDIVYLANLIPGKGALDFIDACESIVRQVPEFAGKFVLMGGTADRQYEQLVHQRVAESPNYDHFVVTGHATASVKAAHLSRARCFIYPSSYPLEALPLVLLEAMSYGVPIAAYDVGGIADLVPEGRGGVVVPQGDIANIVDFCVRLLRSEDFFQGQSAAARANYSASYRPDHFTETWRELLVSVGAMAPADRPESR